MTDCWAGITAKIGAGITAHVLDDLFVKLIEQNQIFAEFMENESELATLRSGQEADNQSGALLVSRVEEHLRKRGQLKRDLDKNRKELISL